MLRGQIYCIVAAILAATTFCEDIKVTWNCGACSNLLIGKNCYVLNGGPFLSFEVSIDKQAASCSATNQTYPITYNFNCNYYSCSESCSIRIQRGFSYTYYCPVYQDTDQNVKKINDMYFLASGNKNYQWCLHAGCPNKLISNSLILAFLFGLIVFCLIAGLTCLVRKKKKMQQTPRPLLMINDQD